ncbi:hypothetical protein C8J57DRAFT_1254121 [Mycena rebaudengoi]|nr:hypothetical protein C8J57DRAFT_1254121 [Mycena rebaudengoi]
MYHLDHKNCSLIFVKRDRISAVAAPSIVGSVLASYQEIHDAEKAVPPQAPAQRRSGTHASFLADVCMVDVEEENLVIIGRRMGAGIPMILWPGGRPTSETFRVICPDHEETPVDAGPRVSAEVVGFHWNPLDLQVAKEQSRTQGFWDQVEIKICGKPVGSVQEVLESIRQCGIYRWIPVE